MARTRDAVLAASLLAAAIIAAGLLSAPRSGAAGEPEFGCKQVLLPLRERVGHECV